MATVTMISYDGLNLSGNPEGANFGVVLIEGRHEITHPSDIPENAKIIAAIECYPYDSTMYEQTTGKRRKGSPGRLGWNAREWAREIAVHLGYDVLDQSR